MDSDQGKLFIGGISWETTEANLSDYFGKYGAVLQAVVMRDKLTGKPRGFAFVNFEDPSILDRVLQDVHTINGRTVEAKRAMSREEQQTSSKSGNFNPSRSTSTGGVVRTKKIFVGGLPASLTEEGFRQYFEGYGNVTDVVVMYDQTTQRPRGFGFISFESEESVDRVLHKTFHDLDGKQVEVKRALPKEANPGGSSRSMSGSGGSSGGGGGGNYQGYNASGGNSGGYEGRADSNRYMQPQNTGGSFPPYGASSYGYGPANNGLGFGAYGAYGGANSLYGGPNGGGYGNPNLPTGSYPGGTSGAPRSSWSSQASSGYGAVSYGNAWGAGAGGGSGSGPGPNGQSPSGAPGYGNQAYGYGGYGGSDSSYANPSGYGAVGGRTGCVSDSNVPCNGVGGGESQGNGGAYMGGGYGDVNGTSGYGNVWRSDPSQASGNYAGPHGNGPNGNGGQAVYGAAAYGGQSRQ